MDGGGEAALLVVVGSGVAGSMKQSRMTLFFKWLV